MSSSRSTGCPPREAWGVCPPLPRGDTRKMISECPPREAWARSVCPPLPRDDTCKMITECPPREAWDVLLAKHGVSAHLYHAATDITVCPSHTAGLSRCLSHTARCRDVSITHRAISRGVSVTHRRVMLRCVRHTLRYITRCVCHTLLGYLAVHHTPRDVAMCPSHTAQPLPEKVTCVR